MDLERWFREAEEHVTRKPDLPLISSPVLHIAHDACEAWNDLLWAEESPRVAPPIPPHNPNRLNERFAVLSFLYRLTHLVSHEDPDDVDEIREVAGQSLGDAVRLVDVDACGPEPRVLVWESVNACLIGDWTRAQALVLRLAEKGSWSKAVTARVLGRFFLLSVWAEGDPKWETEWWSPAPEPNAFFVGHIYLEAIWLEDLSGDDDFKEREEVTASQARLLDSAIAEFERAKTELNPAEHAALAWSYWAKARKQQDPGYYMLAARACRELLERPNPFADLMSRAADSDGVLFSDSTREQILSASSLCFRLAGDLEEAKRIISTWLKEYPKTPGVAERLAEIEAKRGDYQAAYEAMAKEIATNPRYEHDWKARLLTELATRPTNSVAASDQLASFLEKDDRYRDLGEAVTTHHWPTFSQLGDVAKSNWLAGLLLLHDTELRTQLRESAWWSAARSFGTATEMELRDRVFDRFATDCREESMKWPVPGRPESKGDLLARFTETGHPKPTLGLMVDWLELVQKPGPQSRHAAIQALHQWILRRNKKLKNRRDFERLRSHLVEARNDAVHEQVSEKDALALCREAEQLLTEISDLPAPDDPFIHPKAAQRSKLLFVTASSRFRGRQLSSGGCATH